MSAQRQRILVIRLGALGDLIFCFRAFEELRQAYPDAEIALLTRAPFADFARAMPWFDRVIVDTHPLWVQPKGWRALLRAIKDFNPDLVIDLQGKTRQTILYWLLGGSYFAPAWSGAAWRCKHPRPWPPVPGMHFSDFLAAQLRTVGVPEAPPPDLRWLDAQVGRFALPSPYVVMIPGCSAGSEYKRWPPAKYAELARRLATLGLASVAVGGPADAAAIASVRRAAPDVFDLCGQTSLLELAGVLRHARGVVGNDTGPLHMAAALGAPTLALLSGRTDAAWSRPPGIWTAVVQQTHLRDLEAGAVLGAFEALMHNAEGER